MVYKSDVLTKYTNNPSPNLELKYDGPHIATSSNRAALTLVTHEACFLRPFSSNLLLHIP